ncbi:MAG TPA: hypothetical protein VJT33_05675 [bacterium]|nr:hypothetical protein [bacterium]
MRHECLRVVVKRFNTIIEGGAPWFFALVGVLMVIASYVYERRIGVQAPAVRELGFVAVILGVAIFFERRRLQSYTGTIATITSQHLQEIKVASIQRILRGVLPDEFISLLNSVLLGAKFLRDNQRMDITLEWREANRTYVKMYFRYDYRVTNKSESPDALTCPIGAAESLAMENLYPGETIIRYIHARHQGSNTFLFSETNYAQRSEDGFYIAFGRDVLLSGGQSVLVGLQSERIAVGWGEEPFVFLVPSQGLDITVHHPIDMKVEVEMVHPHAAQSPLRPLTSTAVGGIGTETLSFDEAIFPYWSLVVQWQPKPAQGTQIA